MQYAKSAVTESQIDYVFDQLRANAWPHTVAVLVTTGVLWFTSHSFYALLWMALMLMSHMVRLYTVDSLWQHARQHGDYRRVKPLLVAGMLYAGAIWGLVPVWFMNQPQTESVIFISIALAGMCASTLPALAAFLPAYIAFILPVLSLLIIKLFLLGLSATALLGVACLTAFVMISSRINQIITMSITMDFQNRELLEQVTVAKEKAEAANQAKSRFLAVASHDLRQPLQALGLILESMKLKRQQDTPEQKMLVQQGVNCHDALTDMFNSLMDLSRLEANDLSVSPAHVELGDLLSMLAREFEPAAQAKNLQLNCVTEPCVVWTDPMVLGRIIRNLLSNAIKFTDSGTVELRIQCLADKVLVLVQDSGRGIPLDEQSRVFEEYHQVFTHHRQQGVGLGLSVVKRLAVLLQLDLQLESVPGAGTTFRLVLPKGDPALVTRQEEVSGFSLQGCRVLVVDDEPALLEATCSLLAEWGCEVMAADGKDAALAHADTSAPPQIIVSDYHLQGCTGLSVIRAVQSCLDQPVPAVLMSGDTSPQLVQNMRDNALFLLKKPVKPVHLRKVLRQLLQQPPVT
ncbi:MAG: hybrid sensor histidine kinase/response regulator [Ketobacter sp.]|nr:hybrid sensor histidine kinase/response regulator [Ketobacter sp.]